MGVQHASVPRCAEPRSFSWDKKRKELLKGGEVDDKKCYRGRCEGKTARCSRGLAAIGS